MYPYMNAPMLGAPQIGQNTMGGYGGGNVGGYGSSPQLGPYPGMGPMGGGGAAGGGGYGMPQAMMVQQLIQSLLGGGQQQPQYPSVPVNPGAGSRLLW